MTERKNKRKIQETGSKVSTQHRERQFRERAQKEERHDSISSVGGQYRTTFS